MNTEEKRKERQRKWSKAWRDANPEKSRSYQRARRAESPEKSKNSSRNWRLKNPKRAKKLNSDYVNSCQVKTESLAMSRRQAWDLVDECRLLEMAEAKIKMVDAAAILGRTFHGVRKRLHLLRKREAEGI